MRISKYAVAEAFVLLAISIIWCEVGYYYFVFHYHCGGWPGPTSIKNEVGFKRILVLADTHIMGKVKSASLDKFRREWQMKQAFSIARRIYKPDLYIFLGDIFDEASFAQDVAYEEACKDFEMIFPIDPQERLIIAGNHDVGFHNQLINYRYIMQRFLDKYHATPSIELIKKPNLKDINLVVTNSMTFYNDTCSYCSESIAATNRIAYDLEKQRNLADFSAPILLSHMPLYRSDDTQCDYPFSLGTRVKDKNMEGEDVLHMVSSRFLLQRLMPRLVLSGHTHMDCATSHNLLNHNSSIKELTITSFNHKYAEKTPGFLLLSANSTHEFTKSCQLVEEYIIMFIYVLTTITIMARFYILGRG